MRGLPGNLLTSLQSETMNLAWCLILTRADGVQLGFTEHDRSLTVGGVVCEPASGASLTAIATSSVLSVDNADMTAFLDSPRLTENDLMKGVYDGARVELVLVDWTNTAQGGAILQRGILGEISSGELYFKTEFRSLTQYLQQTIGRKCGIECDVERLGNERCTVVLAPFTHSAVVDQVIDDRTFLVLDGGPGNGVADFYAHGIAQWTNSDDRNTEFEYRIKTWDENTYQIELTAPTVSAVQAGDTLDIIAGCDRTADTCKTKFNNFVNFQGFPHVPGRDGLFETPSAKT